jgi:hypothetical protein
VAHENPLGEKILQRKTKRVKFNGAIIIANKFTDATEVLDDGWGDKTLFRMKG